MKMNSFNSEIDIREINKELVKLMKYIPCKYPATGWYFTPNQPNGSIAPNNESWSCIFSYINKVVKGNRLCLSVNNSGCSGAACYLGFKEPSKQAGIFLSDKEKFKKTSELGHKFYSEIQAHPAKDTYIVLECIKDMKSSFIPEVVTLWVDALSLSGLVTLSNYDREDNDNVIIPFASGCQSIWSIPYKEKYKSKPKSTVGLLDPAARRFIPKDVLAFSVPINRFIDMTRNISGSFLETEQWTKLLAEN